MDGDINGGGGGTRWWLWVPHVLLWHPLSRACDTNRSPVSLQLSTSASRRWPSNVVAPFRIVMQALSMTTITSNSTIALADSCCYAYEYNQRMWTNDQFVGWHRREQRLRRMSWEEQSAQSSPLTRFYTSVISANLCIHNGRVFEMKNDIVVRLLTRKLRIH